MRWYWWLIIFVLLFAAIGWVAMKLWKKEKNSDQLAQARKVREEQAAEKQNGPDQVSSDAVTS